MQMKQQQQDQLIWKKGIRMGGLQSTEAELEN